MPDADTHTDISIVMPAYRAEATIIRAVKSVLAQTHPHWELIIVADDGQDYETLLDSVGFFDRRIRHVSTGRVGAGSSLARNVGLDHARFARVATLDADDAMLPGKLGHALPHLKAHGIVSSALRVESADGSLLRTVGAGPDRVLGPGIYKFVNLSMDSMLVYDRKKADPRYNPDFPCLVDIEFLLRLWAVNPTVFHLGTPQHVYTKQLMSISNNPEASAAMIATKKRLITEIGAGTYPLVDPDARTGLIRFYEISLTAEQSYGARLLECPGLLFEDHLEPMLKTQGMA